MDGDTIAGPESPVEEIASEAAHGGVELSVSDAAVSRLHSSFARLPFGVAVQGAIHCHGLILMSGFGEGKQ